MGSGASSAPKRKNLAQHDSEELLVDFLGMRFPGVVRIHDLVDLASTLVEECVAPALWRRLPEDLEDVFHDLPREKGALQRIEKDNILWWTMEKSDWSVSILQLTVTKFQQLLAHEFLSNLPPHLGDSSSAVMAAFEHADADADGYVTAQEFEEAMKNLCSKCTADSVAYVFHEVDANGNGVVDIEEFFEWLDRRNPSGSWDVPSLLDIVTTALVEAPVRGTCSVCFCEEPAHKLVHLHGFLDTCTEKACKDCVSHGIASEGFMRCPCLECRQIVDVVNLLQILTAEEQTLYLERTLGEFKKQHLELLFHCKTPDCPNFVIMGKPIAEKNRDVWTKRDRWRCRICHNKWCVICGRPSTGEHYQRSCTEVDELEKAAVRKQHEEIDAALLLTCSCHTNLLKIGGCKFITCSNERCRKNWCWVCRAGPSDEKHFHHDCLIGPYYAKYTRGPEGSGEHPIDSLEDILEEICKFQRRDLGKSEEQVRAVLKRFMEERRINVDRAREHFKNDLEVWHCLPISSDHALSAEGPSGGHGLTAREAQLVGMGFGIEDVRAIFSEHLGERGTVEQALELLLG